MSSSVCVMERYWAEQEEKLAEEGMEMDRLARRSRDPPAEHRHCFRCMVVLVAAMVLVIIALVPGFVVMRSCREAAAQARPTDRINITTNLKESGEKGSYDVFTADKTATYLIYGWLNLAHINSGEVVLRNTFKGDSVILEQKDAGKEVFFFQKVKLVDFSRISIYFNASCTDNLFHVLEVGTS